MFNGSQSKLKFCITKLAIRLKKIIDGISLTFSMFMQAVYTPPSMRDLLSDKKWGWSEVGKVDETVWEQLRNYIPPASSNTKGTTRPGLSPLELSKAPFIQILNETC